MSGHLNLAGAATPRRATLPVSGATASWHAPTGHEEALLAEGRAGDPALALALVRAVTTLDDGRDPSELPVTDFDTLVCRIRMFLLGDRIVAETRCRNPDCGARIDVAFLLSDYLAYQRPRRPRGVAADAVAGWFTLSHDGARFRLPTIADLIAAEDAPDPAAAVARRCFELPRPRARRRAERAMAAMAPLLAGPLGGTCAECATPIAVHFAARDYCLQELCDRARFVFDDVDVLAARYHWAEAEILALPAARRTGYAELARRALAAGTA